MDLSVISPHVPTLLWGSPGVGKTAAVKQYAEHHRLHLEVVVASVREPSDFGGLPIITDDGVKLQAPAWAMRLIKAGKGILFLDEISTAPPAVQAALLRVVLDRVIGDAVLPSNIIIIAAANPPDQAAGGWDLAPPLANRFMHVQVKQDPNNFIENFPSYWGEEPNLIGIDQNKWREARSLISSWIRRQPNHLLKLPDSESSRGGAWASPRSWDNASKLWAMAGNTSINDRLPLVAGCVGEGVAMEFITWAGEMDLPDPEMILNKGEYKVTGRGDLDYAVITSVIATAISRLTNKRWMSAWSILESASKQGAADVGAVAAKSLAKARTEKLPMPSKAIKAYIPILKAAGLINE